MRPSAAFAVALVLLAAVVTLPAPAQDYADVTIETTPLTPHVAMLTGAGGNIGVCFGKEGVLLVDGQHAALTERILAAVGRLADGPVRVLVNTHWHHDHTGGNENLARAGALIVAHENVRRRLSTEQHIAAFDRTVPPSPALALPALTFADSLVLHLDGEEIAVFHVPPAHTDGDAVVHFRTANVIHAGDLFFNGLYPYIDYSGGGRLDGMIAAARRILALCDDGTRIIPGHGPLAGRADLETYLAMLEDVHARLAADIAAGRSLEEILDARPTARWDDPWGKEWLDGRWFADIAYRSLTWEAASPAPGSR